MNWLIFVPLISFRKTEFGWILLPNLAYTSTAPYAKLLKLTNSEQEHGKNNTEFNKDTNREAISAYLDLVRTFLLFTFVRIYDITLEVRRAEMNGQLFQYEEWVKPASIAWVKKKGFYFSSFFAKLYLGFQNEHPFWPISIFMHYILTTIRKYF